MSDNAFGARVTSHMLRQRFENGRWTTPEITPYGNIAISPLAKSLHYGQSVFEGMKAYKSPTGEIAIFRPIDHLHRLQRSARRLCLPEIDVDVVAAALQRLIALDSGFVPEAPGSLYIRPVLFATEGALCPRPAERFELLIVLCPVGGYINAPDGLRLTTNPAYVRAAPGGTGFAKCSGNYAAPLPATEQAKAQGFDEVLWLDAIERRFIEEVGTMNVFFVRDGRLLTPPTSDTILSGMTRESVLTLARDAGMEVGEERIAVDSDEWRDVSEVLTTGTAAGVMHVRELVHNGRVLFSRKEVGPVCQALGAMLDDARHGLDADPHGWRRPVRIDAAAPSGAVGRAS